VKRKFVQIQGELVEVDNAYQPIERHQVMPDFQPFIANDGTLIKGRRQWREHLKQTGGLEMGHADIQAGTQAFQRRKAQFHQKVREGEKYIAPATFKPDAKPEAPSRLSIEVANRLHGKERPSRRELVQLAVELKRREIRR
jgi:hypothetical protein